MRNLIVMAVGSLAVLAATDVGRAQSLNASGSSFIGPMMDKWGRDYHKLKGIKVNYVMVGSGAGIRQLLEKETDLGCTDAPMSDAQLQTARQNGGKVVHIPVALGAVVVAYNLEGVREPLRLMGPVLADIFFGKITKWDDPAIKEINPGLDLPTQDIAVVYRSDASGTTFIFTDYLAKVSDPWKARIGRDVTVRWPVGHGRKGNEDVAAEIQRTPGAIGYVELLHALRNKVTHARLKNREGNFVQASLEGVTAAASACNEIPDDLRFSLTNAPGKDSYPISSATWAVFFLNQPKDRGKRVVDFLQWVTHDGQDAVTDLFYARLPKELVAKIEGQLKHADVRD
jgi:phosphate ABC transporter phosphate-binding protein